MRVVYQTKYSKQISRNMIYQFSFSSDYYKERMKIYLGEEKVNDIDQVEESILKFICAALGKR